MIDLLIILNTGAVLNVSKNMKDKERYSYYSAEGEKKKQE